MGQPPWIVKHIVNEEVINGIGDPFLRLRWLFPSSLSVLPPALDTTAFLLAYAALHSTIFLAFDPSGSPKPSPNAIQTPPSSVDVAQLYTVVHSISGITPREYTK